MVTTSKLNCYQQDPAWTSPNLNHATAFLRHGHNLGVPSLYSPCICAANAVSPRPSCFAPGLPSSKAANQNGVKWLPSLAPPKNEYPNDTSFLLHRLIGLDSPPTDASANSQKRFLICDQSGSQTRFYFSQGRPLENEVTTPKEHAYGLYYENLTAVVERRSPVKPIIEDKLEESYINGEESSMHEDTEEINALLYSSDGTEVDEDDDDCGEDDEVTSTARSPCANNGGCGCGEHDKLPEELTEEVASSDGPCKRQRLPDGGHKKSSSIESRWANDDDDDIGESRCVKDSLPLREKDEEDHDLSTRKRKAKIRETLRILESLIPGIKSKDPLLVIDEAIDYLKSLRGKAKALGVGLPQEYPPSSC
ncbi:transcription factor bHLH143 [Nicotiana tabacum]|uniref:Transcription factor SAC51 isoform X1 n=1 Tax=Nicotiana tabacum TaxID=4097 RepID=A0A1S4BV90_TOBAC|nr:PREDICTED: transcription factor SAC51-like isoform X1 [Nicotiana tabacum]